MYDIWSMDHLIHISVDFLNKEKGKQPVTYIIFYIWLILLLATGGAHTALFFQTGSGYKLILLGNSSKSKSVRVKVSFGLVLGDLFFLSLNSFWPVCFTPDSLLRLGPVFLDADLVLVMQNMYFCTSTCGNVQCRIEWSLTLKMVVGILFQIKTAFSRTL